MYNQPYFKLNHDADVLELMRQNLFVTLAANGQGGTPVATMVPVLLREEGEKLFIETHIMRKTDHADALLNDPRVLIIFNGPHAYVSAKHYPDPAVAGTWNYIAVYARGKMMVKDDAWLMDFLMRLTAHHENDPGSPALVKNMPEEYLRKLLPAIVGLEMEVESLEHTGKLSQNKDGQTRKLIFEKFLQGTEDEKSLANWMKHQGL